MSRRWFSGVQIGKIQRPVGFKVWTPMFKLQGGSLAVIHRGSGTS